MHLYYQHNFPKNKQSLCSNATRLMILTVLQQGKYRHILRLHKIKTNEVILLHSLGTRTLETASLYKTCLGQQTAFNRHTKG